MFFTELNSPTLDNAVNMQRFNPTVFFSARMMSFMLQRVLCDVIPVIGHPRDVIDQ